MRIEIYEDSAHRWRWRAIEANGRIIADSAEGYISKSHAERAADNVMSFFRSDVSVICRKQKRLRATDETHAAPDLEIEGMEYDVLATYQAEGEHE